MESDQMLWDMLKSHIGHQVRIVAYGDTDDPMDICLECEECGEVIPKAIRSVCRPDCHHRIGRLCFMACSCSYEYQIAQRRFRGR